MSGVTARGQDARQVPKVGDWSWGIRMAIVSETRERRATRMERSLSRGPEVRFEVCTGGLWIMQGQAKSWPIDNFKARELDMVWSGDRLRSS